MEWIETKAAVAVELFSHSSHTQNSNVVEEIISTYY